MASQAEGPGSVIKVGEGHMPRAGGEGKCALLEWQEESMREGARRRVGTGSGRGRGGELGSCAESHLEGHLGRSAFQVTLVAAGRGRVWKAGPVRKRTVVDLSERQRQQGRDRTGGGLAGLADGVDAGGGGGEEASEGLVLFAGETGEEEPPAELAMPVEEQVRRTK